MSAVNAKAVLAVGAAVATPTLLGLGQQAGIPIPAYVTDAQRAAIATLNASGLPKPASQGESMFAWVTTWKAAHPSGDDAGTLVDALVRAVHAGFSSGGELGCKGYQLSGWQCDPSHTSLYEKVWDKLSSGDTDGMRTTALGDALVAAIAASRAAGSWFGSSDDPKVNVDAVTKAGLLAIEADEQGYLITGKPPDDPTIWGGIKAAGAAVGDFFEGVASGALGVAGNALEAIVFSLPGLLVISGYLVYRAVRK